MGLPSGRIAGAGVASLLPVGSPAMLSPVLEGGAAGVGFSIAVLILARRRSFARAAMLPQLLRQERPELLA